MEYAIRTVSAAPVRREPGHRAEMVNQLLFGETMQVLEMKEEWLKIRSLYDDYEGWLTPHLINEIEGAVANAPLHFVATGLVNPVIKNNQLINVSMGASLTGFDEERKQLWNENYTYHGMYSNCFRSFDKKQLWCTASAWLNAPYLWGGRTFMGVDCSGFVQTVFKVLGIRLKRDAHQQAVQGQTIENLQDAQFGDVAFFHTGNGHVTHVGIICNNKQIIHASGRVRIDTLDRQGIIHSETGKRTHQLHSMRRYF